MVDTIFGGISAGLESTKESLLSTQDLHGGRRVLGQVGEGAGVRDEAGSNLRRQKHG